MMQIVIDLSSCIMLILGIFFFLSSILALWRFPDTLCRLHAVTKADNLGLGFITVAVGLQLGWSILLLKLIVVYVLVLYGSSLNGYLIANSVYHNAPKASGEK